MFKTLNSVALHYHHRTAANGAATLVFINSLGTDFRIWSDVVDGLPRELGVLNYDKRGHGLSDVGEQSFSIGLHGDDLIKILETENLKKAVLCGLSVGGLIALDVWSKRPDLVDGLVLMDTAPQIGDFDTWQARIDKVRGSGMAAIGDATMERWFSPAFHLNQQASVAGYKNMLCRTPADGYVGTCDAIRNADYRKEAASVTVPTLCLVGSEDAATPPPLVEAMAQLIPNAVFYQIDGAGHLPCVECPTEIVGHLKAFLATTLREVHEGARFEAGMSIRQKVLGEPHVERANRNQTSFDAPFQRLITEAAWGHVWSRPTWTLRERSIVTIALLAALGHDEEVAMHARATANTGASQEDLCEAMLHVAIYAGVPAANSAIKTIKNTLSEESGSGERE